jgi:hypothetical protein
MMLLEEIATAAPCIFAHLCLHESHREIKHHASYIDDSSYESSKGSIHTSTNCTDTSHNCLHNRENYPQLEMILRRSLIICMNVDLVQDIISHNVY